MPQAKYRHLILDERFRDSEGYTQHKIVINPESSQWRPRIPHAEVLKNHFEQAWESQTEAFAVAKVEREGVYVEFRSDPGAELVTKSLEDLKSKKIRLLNIRTESDENGQETTFATVYVANEKRGYFVEKIEEFATLNSREGSTKPRNGDLIYSISDIRSALMVESFWTDSKELIPKEGAEFVEVWLRVDSSVAGVEATETKFRELCKGNEIPIEIGSVRFPERCVVVVNANVRQLEQLTLMSDDIAEYRKAKETAAYWINLENIEKREWVDDLLGRLLLDEDSSVSVCILDTGLNAGHPLINPLTKEGSIDSFDVDWGSDDHQGHGTLMAGLVGYGNLVDALNTNESVQIRHSLESVKFIPPAGNNPKHLYGHITSQSVNRAETNDHEKKRIICLAVTSKEDRDNGRPSSWSGKIDALASGTDDGFRRLFVVSAGNIEDTWQREIYPDGQKNESVHDPAQSWNAVTVGSFTELTRITGEQFRGYRPLAQKGELSPFTSTSHSWTGDDDKWPLKPDIVMEGGNAAIKEGDLSEHGGDDLCLLSTYYKPDRRLFEGFNMTSASTALASRLAAQILAEYPDLWPETIRALMIHSADWTEALKKQFLSNSENPSKTEIKELVRICGWGVPDLDRALYTLGNSLTLISEAEIQPFIKQDRVKTNEMHVYQLPWPKDVLQSLPLDTVVRMRVTLSYFVEPGPGQIGWKDKYRYPSHQLRFKVIRPGETMENFRARVSAAAESDPDEEISMQGASNYWTLGSKGRSKGSLHSDIWTGTAQELASSNAIAVHPVIGWWRERSHLGKFNSRSRYALIVSIHSDDESIDMYIPVAIQVGVPVATEIEI